eukprot:350519-Chlamydomonas_euryale.AAC.1
MSMYGMAFMFGATESSESSSWSRNARWNVMKHGPLWPCSVAAAPASKLTPRNLWGPYHTSSGGGRTSTRKVVALGKAGRGSNVEQQSPFSTPTEQVG